MKHFVFGRTHVFEQLERSISKDSSYIWIHAASLGEYEQGVPIMEALQKQYPTYKLLVSFFSPSGFEVKKDNALAEITTYLPLDTPKNAKKFVAAVSPKLVIFIKYEIWPNYLFQLKKQTIPVLLVSGVFRENQLFFKPYGKFMLAALQTFQHLFVQEKASEKLLKKHGFNNVSVSGDTRFDRVSQQLIMDNSLPFIEKFIDGKTCIVCGSTWPEDEAVLKNYINTVEGVKFIIAPHEIQVSKIKHLQQQLQKKTLLFSEKSGKEFTSFEVLIIDTIGLLSKIYSYADIAYVGGAMGTTGLHNILEPAIFGVPIVIGKNYQKFPEAIALVEKKGLFSIASEKEVEKIMHQLVTNKSFSKKTGHINAEFIRENTGATPQIIQYIQTKIPIFLSKH